MSLQRGFNIMELMVVLSIAAILTLIALPNFGPYMADQKSDSYTTSLLSTLRLARNEAITRGTNITICPVTTVGGSTCNTGSGATSNWSSGWVIKDAATNTIIRSYPAITPNAITNCMSSIVFTPLGKLETQPNCSYLLKVQPQRCTRGYNINASPTISTSKFSCP